MNRKEKLIAIELIPGSEIPEDQVAGIQKIFASAGLPVKVSSTVYLRKAEGLPPIVAFALGTIAGGFLGAMGKDAWEAFKRGLSKTFLLLRERWKQNPKIELQFEEKDSRIILNLPTENEELMEEALNNLPAYLGKWPKGRAWMVFDKDTHEWKEV